MSNDEQLSDPYQCLHCGNTAPMAIRGHHKLILKC